MNSVDACYAEYLTGTITRTRCINTIVSFLYENPCFIQSETMTPDNFQDFMVFCHPLFSQFLDTYDKSRSSFSTYIKYCLFQQKKKYYKHYYQIHAKQHAVYDFLSSEVIPQAADPSDAVCTMPFRQMTLKQIENEIPGFKKVRSLSPAQKILIITLKACQFVDADHVRWVAELIQMPEDEVTCLLHEIRQTMEIREKRLAVYRERINRAYMRKKQLQYELAGTETGSYLHSKLQTSLELQNKLLEKYATVSQSKPPEAPTNKEIARLLSVTSSSVSHFLTALHDKNDKIAILNT